MSQSLRTTKLLTIFYVPPAFSLLVIQQNFLYMWDSSQIPVFSALLHLTGFHSSILSVSGRPDSPSTYIKTRFLPSVTEAAITYSGRRYRRGSFFSRIHSGKASLYILLFNSFIVFCCCSFFFLVTMQVIDLLCTFAN